MADEKSHAQPIVLERGHMYVLFRPKIDVEESHALKDVERLYLWLAPDRVSFEGSEHAPPNLSSSSSSSSKSKSTPVYKSLYHRLIIMPHKQLPHHTSRERYFAFVDKVAGSSSEIQQILGEIHHHTKTKGERTTHAARVVAECIYEIVQYGEITYLVYELEFPTQIHEAQRVFNLEPKAMFMIQAKNPNASVVEGQPHISKKSSTPFPKECLEHFRGKRVQYKKFASLMPQMLDYEGLEMIWFGAKDVQQVLGDEITNELDRLVELDMKKEHVKSEEDAKQTMQAETGRDVVMNTLED